MLERLRINLAMSVALLLTSAGCEQKVSERVLGDYGSQPETVVTRLPGEPLADVRPVVESAKRSVASIGDALWPEPVRIVEHEAHWAVSFEYRRKLVDVDGNRQIRAQLPAGVGVEVQKADLSARLIPGR